MKKFIKFCGRFLLLPFVLFCLGGTAFFEALEEHPDWGHWKEFNRHMLDLLPWRVYVNNN